MIKFKNYYVQASISLMLVFGFGHAAHAVPCSEALPWYYNGVCYATQGAAEAVLKGITNTSGVEGDQDWRMFFVAKPPEGNKHAYYLPPRPHLPDPAWRTTMVREWKNWGWNGIQSPVYYTYQEAEAWLEQFSGQPSLMPPDYLMTFDVLTYRGTYTSGAGLQYRHYSDNDYDGYTTVYDPSQPEWNSCAYFGAPVSSNLIGTHSHSVYQPETMGPPDLINNPGAACDVNGTTYRVWRIPTITIGQASYGLCQSPYTSNGTECVYDKEEIIWYGGQFTMETPGQSCPAGTCCDKPDNLGPDNESNPCNPADGTKTQVEVDYVSPADGGLEFVRYYSSKGAYKTDEHFGTGWRHTYSRRIDEEPDTHPTVGFAAPVNQSNFYYTAADACTLGWNDLKATVWSGDLASATATFSGGNVCKISQGGNTVAYFPIRVATGFGSYTPSTTVKTITRPNGSSIKFEFDGSKWVNYLNPGLKLEQVGSEWVYTDANDTKETYNSSGSLISIETREGRVTTLTYGTGNTAGKIIKVTGPFGHWLDFGYDYYTGRLSYFRAYSDGFYRFYYTDDRLTRVQDTNYKDRTFLYERTDLKDHLTGIIDRNGDRIATWDYDDAGRAILSEHAGGKERVEFAYNPDNSTTLTLANGATRTYHYSTEQGERRLTMLTGDVCSTCPGGAIADRTYDANGFIEQIIDWNGNVTETLRNARGLTETLTEAKGTPLERTTTTVWHPTYRLPTQITSPKNVTDFTYDTSGNLLTMVVTGDGETRGWTFTYNAAGQPLTIDGPRTDVTDVTTLEYYECTSGTECGQLKSVTDALGHVTNYNTYDASGRLKKMTDANGLQTSYLYNYKGKVYKVTLDPVTGSNRYINLTYDYEDQLKTVSFPSGQVLTYSYDAAHYLRTVTDNFSNRIEYDYDAMGNLKDEDTVSPASAIKRAVDYVYDLNNRLDSVNNGGFVTDLTLDMVGNLTSETDPESATTQHSYDALNRLDSTIDALTGVIDYAYDEHDNLASVTAANGASTTFVSDDLDNLTSEISPDRGTLTYTYDDAGNRITELDARGKLTSYSYDELNRLTLITLDGGGTIAYEYDVGANAIGRLNKITDSSGQSTWAYNGFGEVSQKIQTIGTVALSTSYSWDAQGRLSSMTLPSGKVLAYTYNIFQPTGITVSYQTILSGATYDPFGPVTGWTWGNGSVANRQYDLRGLVSTQSLGGYARLLGYDDAGQVTSIVDSHFDGTFDYDLLGRLSTSSSIIGTGSTASTSSQYWLALAEVGAPDTSYLQSISVPAGGAFDWNPTMPSTPGNYEFRLFENGGFNRVETSATVTVAAAQSPPPPTLHVSATQANAGQSVSTTVFNTPGNPYDWFALATVGAPNNSYLQWAYVNTTGGTWQVNMPGTPGDYEFRLFINNGYTRVATSSAVTVPATSNVPLPLDVSATLVYAGDSITVMVSADAAGSLLIAQDFTYDENGNRESITENSTAYTYNLVTNSNRLASTTGPIAKSYTYDAAGNVLSDNLHTYGYDDRGRLVSLDSGAVTYAHNGQGQRVKKQNGSTSTLFAYDESGRLMGEYDQSGAAIQETVWFNGAPVAVLIGSNKYYVHTDHLGTPRAITNGNTVIWRWDADPFGIRAPDENPDGDLTLFTYNLRFPGQYYDQESGLHYNYHRTYDPSTGRYLESDPIGLIGGLNTYGYVGANPNGYFDFFGLARSLIVVGDPGLGLHNVGRNFDRVAETLKSQIESDDCGCNSADIVRASNVEAMNRALTSGETIDGDVYFVGHSAAQALFIGQTSASGTNLDAFSLIGLSREHNIALDAGVVLLSCNAGRQSDDSVSIAQMMANRLKRRVTAYSGDLLFSPNPASSGTGASPGARPPVTGPLYMVPAIDGLTPIIFEPK
jgi:RHS repeat-associated protein